MELRDLGRFVGLLALFNGLDILSALFWLQVYSDFAHIGDQQDNLIMAACATVLWAIRERKA